MAVLTKRRVRWERRSCLSCFIGPFSFPYNDDHLCGNEQISLFGSCREAPPPCISRTKGVSITEHFIHLIRSTIFVYVTLVYDPPYVGGDDPLHGGLYAALYVRG